jgi:UDP-GlcNAc:undecaprenyl-phosphate GlcNAc-1-phosphate transferase
VEALAIALALVVALVSGWIAIVAGRRLGIADVPDDDLKPHHGAPVPLGGAVLLIAVHVGLALAGVFDIGLLTASLLVWVVGMVDDLRGLSSILRLLATISAGVVLVALSERPFDTGEAIFWVVAVAVIVNAINLLDGLDALAGSVATVAVLGITWFGFTQGISGPLVPLIIAAALLGFLFWNRPEARLFLGDNGAYVLGLFLVWAAMWVSPDRMAGVVATGLIGVPLIDLGVTVFRRGLSSAPLFSGDRDHTYDRLYRYGMSEGGIALLYSVAQAIWVAIIVGVSLFWGDLPTAITALVLGLLIAGVVGGWMTVSRPE